MRLETVLRSTSRALCAGLAVLACGGDSEAELSAAERGRLVYSNVCIACHSADPGEDSAVGPALAGASRELLAAKLLRGEYPPGYTPARGESAVMPRFEYLAAQIDDLATFLADAG